VVGPGRVDTEPAEAAAAPAVVEDWRSNLFRSARGVAAGVLAGLVLGLAIGGIGGRIAMFVLRLTSSPSVIGLKTDDGFTIGRISAETLFLLIGTSFLGVLGGLFYLMVRSWFRPAHRAAVMAVIGGAVGGAIFVRPDGVDPDDDSLVHGARDDDTTSLFHLATFGIRAGKTNDRLSLSIGRRSLLRLCFVLCGGLLRGRSLLRSRLPRLLGHGLLGDRLLDLAAGAAPADALEAARYAITFAEHARIVYPRVADQDHVFISLLVAAKAARHAPSRPLTEDVCQSPIAVFNLVFKESGDFAAAQRGNPAVQALLRSASGERTPGISRTGRRFTY